MEPLSVEMACLLGIQNEVQAVWVLSQAGLNGILLKPETFRIISYF